MRGKNKKTLFDVLTYLILSGLTIVILFPYFWMVLSSLKSPTLISKPNVWFFYPDFESWRTVWLEKNFFHYFLNSTIIGVTSTLLSIAVGSLTAYSIVRFRTGGLFFRFGILAGQMLPPIALVIPLFMIMYYLHLLNTLFAVIITHTVFILPLTTWFLMGFFENVPREMEGQAMIDGCTQFQAFYKVLLPNARPGIVAAMIFSFVISWNDFLYALVLTGEKTKTVPVATAGFWTMRAGIEMGNLSAAVTFALVPGILACFLVQRRLVVGLAAGAMKY